MRDLKQRADDWVAANPAEFAALCVRRAVLFWFPTPASCAERPAIVGWAMAAGFWLTALLAWGAAVSLLVGRHPARWLCLAALVGPALPYTIVLFCLRYRYGVWAITILLSAHAVCVLATVASRQIALRRLQGANWRLKGVPASGLPSSRQSAI